jgi:hypothetical protein
MEFHPGHVPAGIIFDMQVSDALELAVTRPKEEEDRRTPAAEFALIGVVAHFEGFCKNHTAAIINICPQLARRLSERGRDIRLRPVDLLEHAQDLSTLFGSLIVDGTDFGTAKAINTFYGDLLGITPFSSKDAKKFHALLEDRNLLVHHGNIFVPRYSGERFLPRGKGRIRNFVDGLEVTPEGALAAVKFLHDFSIKLRKASRTALQAYLKKESFHLPKSNREALKLLDGVAPFN